MLLCTDRTSLNISRTVGSGVIDVDADVDDDDDDDGGGYLSTTRSGVLRDQRSTYVSGKRGLCESDIPNDNGGGTEVHDVFREN